VEPEGEVTSSCEERASGRIPMIVFEVWLLVIEYKWREPNRLTLIVNALVKTFFGEDARVEMRGPIGYGEEGVDR
jgi:hypothetical protein